MTMMVFVIESVLLCLLFTVIVVSSVLKDPKAWVNDYPPAIRQRALEIGAVPEIRKPGLSEILKEKAGRCLLFAVVFALVVYFANGADTFTQAFLVSYALWFVVAWYDALVLDCVWACHSKKVRIPGTEDMDREYRDYGFHIKMSAFGCVLGIPICALAGIFATLLEMLF